MRRLEAKIGLSDSQCTRGVVCTADELLAGDSQDRIFDRGASVAGERYRFSPHPPNFPCVLQSSVRLRRRFAMFSNRSGLLSQRLGTMWRRSWTQRRCGERAEGALQYAGTVRGPLIATYPGRMLAFVPVPSHPAMSGEKIKGRRKSNFDPVSPTVRINISAVRCSERIGKFEPWRQRTVAPSSCSAEPAFSVAASFGICAITNFTSGSRQGIWTGGTGCLVLMIRSFNS